MAKKKRPHDRPGRSTPRPNSAPDLPDQREIESLLQELTGTKPDPVSSRGRAETLLLQAYRESDPNQRINLANQALKHWPDCSDAMVLLAEHTKSKTQQLRLYTDAVAAAERVLGPEPFKDAVGQFWGMLETRPYMRARLGLSNMQWLWGRREESIAHLRDMLRLNPSDNQGLRYILVGHLLAFDRDEEVQQLLAQFPDESSASWAYTKTLLCFRKEGDTEISRDLLEVAKKKNPYVPDYLIGRKAPPGQQPTHYTLGEESEAITYLPTGLLAWRETDGAIPWLRTHDDLTLKRKAEHPKGRGPLGFVKKWLNTKLPQHEEVWQIESGPLSNYTVLGGDHIRMWVTLVMSQTRRVIVAHALTDEEAPPALMWDVLVKAMEKPDQTTPHRPSAVQVYPGRWGSLRSHVEELGIRWEEVEELDQFEFAFARTDMVLSGDPKPALIEEPDLRPEAIASYYEAAAIFFRQAPWRRLGFESAIKIECDKFLAGPRYGVVMGMIGFTNGLAIYEDIITLQRGWKKEVSDVNAMVSVISILYDEEWTISFIDAAAARRLGWQVARYDAFPMIIVGEGDGEFDLPGPDDLLVADVALRAVAAFVPRRLQDDSTPETVTVRVGTEDFNLVLSWVPPT